MPRQITSNRHDAADYRLVLNAIQHLTQKHPPPLSLANMAQKLLVSTEKLRFVIDRWVGVQPKRYLKHLALGRPRHLPMRHFAVPNRNQILSLPGRNSNLSITWETATLGEDLAQQGKGLTIHYGWFESPFGEVLSLGTERGLCGMVYYETICKCSAIKSMAERWPRARFAEDHDAVESWTRAAFEGGEVRLMLMGTQFQIKVWETLLTIPSGQVTNYAEVARKLGKPKGTLAVGQANRCNPVPWLIPCHRVLYKNGALGGFHLSPYNKRMMLAWEALRADAA